MIIRKSVIAASAIVVALGMTGCSSDESNDGDTAAAASTSQSANDSGSAATGVAAPTADELRATLEALVDPQTPVDEKIALIEKSDERRSNVETMTAAMKNYPVGFEVTNVTVDGTTATADVAITSPHGSAGATPWTWENVDGVWKLSDASTCGLLAMANAPC